MSDTLIAMKILRPLTLFVVTCCLLLTTALHAGNPVNPILFVTQVPIPEEVNTRDVTQSFMSIASPFSNHLADTLHAGRGGSLFVRFANAQVVDLLAVADWSAIPGGKPAADAMAVRNPAVNWTATRAIFSMTTGKPSGPVDATLFLFQLYEITLPTQVQLAANVKPVLTKAANQPAYDNVLPTYAQSGKIVFASDRPYNGKAHLTQREEYLSLPTVSGLWALDPADATTLKLLHHAPSGAFYPFVDSAGRVIFTNWDHLSRDTQAVTDSRPPDANQSARRIGRSARVLEEHEPVRRHRAGEREFRHRQRHCGCWQRLHRRNRHAQLGRWRQQRKNHQHHAAQ